MHHQLGGSTEDDMNKMSVIGHFFLKKIQSVLLLLVQCVHLFSVHAYKMFCFLVNMRVFLLFVASNQHTLTPAVRQYFFRQCHPSPHHVLV